MGNLEAVLHAYKSILYSTDTKKKNQNQTFWATPEKLKLPQVVGPDMIDW